MVTYVDLYRDVSGLRGTYKNFLELIGRSSSPVGA